MAPSSSSSSRHHLHLALTAALISVIHAGCDREDSGSPPDDAEDSGEAPAADADGDGYGEDDCDDDDATVNPYAHEICDGQDNDCDGETDEDDALDAATFYADADGDGFGDPAAAIASCTQPSGAVSDDQDCDDADAAVFPGAAEVCDGDDDDCDGVADDDATDATTWYVDDDEDGYGSEDYTLQACEQPEGWLPAAGDCDDLDPTAFPEATEVCDGIDNDCDGVADPDSSQDAATWYADSDGDGYGDDDESAVSCEAPSGYIETAGDCDDQDPAVSPVAEEACDRIDNDCDGLTDDEDSAVSDPAAWFADADGDGFGDSASSTEACQQPTGYTINSTDCDDTDYDINPGEAEICDELDNNCDGLTDEDDPQLTDSRTWYADADGDGFGDSASSTEACTRPTGYTTSSSDCDDTDYDVNPGATEICGDGVDNDCDGDPGTCWGGSHSLSGADVKITGQNSADYAGRRVAFGGDINGDGMDDLLVGASGADADSGLKFDVGKAYVLFGPVTADGNLSSADLIMTGVNNSDWAGDGLFTAGDTDGDGYDDLLVGAHQADSGGLDSGTVFLVMGPASGGSMQLDSATTAFLGDAPADYLGYAVGGGGDMNGDGYDDVLIGAYGADSSGASSGTVYVIHGPVSAGRIDAADAGYALDGESASDYAGSSVALTGDTDGDGYDDFLVGAYGDDDGGSAAGAAYLVLGPVEQSGDLADSEAKLLGENSSDYAGQWISAAGDVNADGYADSLVGAPYADAGSTDAGITYLLHGPITGGSSSLSSSQALFLGESSSDYAGEYFSSAGDVDGDGGDDILISSSWDDEGGSNAGCTYLVLGPSSGTLSLTDADVKLTGESAGDEVGAVARAGDQNQDGLDDLLIGAHFNIDGGTDAGAAYVVFGDVGI